MNADFSIVVFSRGTCQYPFVKSNVVINLAEATYSIILSIDGIVYASIFVTLFSFL